MEINGKKFISSLESRGLIYQKSGSDDLEEHLNSERTILQPIAFIWDI